MPEPTRDHHYDELVAYIRRSYARKPAALHELADVIVGQLAEEFPAVSLGDAGVACMYLAFYVQVGMTEVAQARLVPLTPANVLALVALVGERLFADHELLTKIDIARDAVDPVPPGAIPTVEQRLAVALAENTRLQRQIDELLGQAGDGTEARIDG
jgi:hypothetical protein